MKKDKQNENEQLLQTAVKSSVYLSLYLPYKAQLFTTQNFRPNAKEKPLIKGAKATLTGDLYADIENQTYGSNPFRLILKPLNLLIDNILDDDNDVNYRLNCELADLLNTNNCEYFVKALIENTFYAVDQRLWKDVEIWLSENHFDWKYNLIEKGFAISIQDVG